jgi:uncharacterized RDD family membrane protein YckC
MVFCTSCGLESPQKILICPQCGNKAFSSAKLEGVKNNIGASDTTRNFRLNNANNGSILRRSNDQYEPAANAKRFGAATIDLTLIWGIVFCLNFILIILFDFKLEDAGYVKTSMLISMIVPSLYFSLQHSGIGQATIGKRLLGLKIITDMGDRISFGLALWRSILPSIIFISITMVYFLLVAVAWLPATFIFQTNQATSDFAVATLVILYVMLIFLPTALLFFNRKRKTLYDVICATRVVEA